MQPFLRTIAIALSLTASGCVTISAWEREVLARPDMTFEGNPHVAGAEAHSADTREGSTGGLGGGGGGCGCN
jgi:hypothetical protein